MERRGEEDVDEGRSVMQKGKLPRVGEQRFMCGEGCSDGAEGNDRAYYRRSSPGTAGPGVFQAFPAYSSAAMHKAPPSAESSAPLL